METINLKSPIVFHVMLGEEKRDVAFSTKTFRGKRGGTGNIPEAKEHIPYEVNAIVIDSSHPWFDLPQPVTITVLWSNVLSVQQEKS
jgi:hypothetical protein